MTTRVALERNVPRAAALRDASRDLVPTLRLVVVCCADHRADPAHVLGLGPSEALVLRNPGGRVTRDVLRSLSVLATVASVEGLVADFEFLVLHHTDCGLSRLVGAEHAALVAEYAGVAADDVPGLELADPLRSSEHDARLLAALVGPVATVTGAVYDLGTGSVTETWVSSG